MSADQTPMLTSKGKLSSRLSFTTSDGNEQVMGNQLSFSSLTVNESPSESLPSEGDGEGTEVKERLMEDITYEKELNAKPSSDLAYVT